jgi:cytochrome bd ubiquinol oxidase subunit II
MRRAEVVPFVAAICFFVLGFAGLLIGIWPNILPPTLTIWDAAAPRSSQLFVIVGLVVLLPVICGYFWWSYRVFRGKVTLQAAYH